MTFSEAREACQAVGSRPDLVVLDQWGRNELMKDMIAQECVWENEGSENSTDDNAWIGLRIFNGTEFAWTFQLGEGEDNHIHDSFVGNEANRGKFPWAATEPKRVNNVEACVSLNVREGAVWSVTNCDRKLRTAVCQDQY
ncbi:lectin c-type domain-containing protein [Ditylenchus destructor]|uniref:Lectin c-type domain-containing protein n=1 Tax=Ditylenchus destructor TaxID=166010 RepID=A0AAD4MTL7_9BILA|nr:lectin c-type domain-containing protein [Ditylenchus destructor]